MKDSFPAMADVCFFPLGDRTVVVQFFQEISDAVYQAVRVFCETLTHARLDAVVEWVPAYASVVIWYDPDRADYAKMTACLTEVLKSCEPMAISEVDSVIEIPVCYGGTYGPDLAHVAAHNRLSEEAVVEIHSGSDYRIHMFGFMPGFPYLGGMSEAIATPRQVTPRLKIPAGSVGIAGKQTGVYPSDSPGGWQLIGRTPLKLFDSTHREPVLLKSSQRVRFIPISESEFMKFQETASSKAPSEARHKTLRPGMTVVQPGFMTTIQDFGRFGYQASGVSVSGAMDLEAMACANLLVGNRSTLACMEVTFAGPIIRFDASMAIAITGADLSPTINGGKVEMNRTLYINQGETLRFGAVKYGFRAYVAVEGGFDVAETLSSCSTDVKSKIGGVAGRAIRAGDVLTNGFIERVVPSGIRTLPENWCYQPQVEAATTVRVILGPEADAFTAAGIWTFLNRAFTVTTACDRMGVRLEGPEIDHAGAPDILSSGLCPGTIQVAGNGQPIVLMSDCQTTGGYTRIGCAASIDLKWLAQAKPGDRIRFEAISEVEAQWLYRKRLSGFSMLEKHFEADEKEKI